MEEQPAPEYVRNGVLLQCTLAKNEQTRQVGLLGEQCSGMVPQTGGVSQTRRHRGVEANGFHLRATYRQ